MNLSLALAGELALWVAALLATWSVIVSALGAALRREDLAKSGVRAVEASVLLLAMAVSGMVVALLGDDLAVVYVARHAGEATSWVWRAAALWAGGEGALLVWALFHAVVSAAALRRLRSLVGPVPLVAGVLGAMLLLLLLALAFAANPFERFVWVPSEGAGLVPLLRHAAFVVQPPLAILSLAASAVPFALLAALAFRTASSPARVVAEARRWLLAAWCAGSGALLLGMWWAYAWPATHDHWLLGGAARSLLPLWLATTVALAMPRAAPPWLRLGALGAPFVTAAAAPLLPLESVLDVVHAIEHAGAGPWLATLLVLASLLLIASMVRLRRAGAAVVWAVSEERTGKRTLAGAGDITGALGAALMLAGLLAAAALRVDVRVLLEAGAEAPASAPLLGPWSVSHQGVSRRDEQSPDGHPLAMSIVVAVVLREDGAPLRHVLAPGVRQRVDAAGRALGPPVAFGAVHRTPRGDLFVALEEVTEDERVGVRVVLTPLVALVWLGGMLLVAGGLVRLVAAGRA